MAGALTQKKPETQQEKNVEALDSKVLEMMRLITSSAEWNKIVKSGDGVKVSEAFLLLSKVIDIYRGKVLLSKEDRKKFDEEFKNIEKVNRDLFSKIETVQLQALNELYSVLEKKQENAANAVGANAAALLAFISAIDYGLSKSDSSFKKYYPYGGQIAEMLEWLHGKSTEVTYTPETRMAVSGQAKIIEHNLKPEGRMLSMRADNKSLAFAYDGSVSAMMDLQFAETSTTLSDALAFAEAASLVEDPNKKKEAASKLADALRQLPSSIPMTKDTRFAEALASLDKGDLDSGRVILKELSGTFTDFYNASSYIYALNLNPKGVTVSSIEGVVELKFDKPIQEFQNAIQNPSVKNRFRVLEMAVGLYQEYLAISGLLAGRRLTVGADGNYVFEEIKQEVRGSAQTVSITPETAFGVKLLGVPMKVTISANFGYLSRKLSGEASVQEVTPNGIVQKGTQQLSVDNETPFMGLTMVRWEFLRPPSFAIGKESVDEEGRKKFPITISLEGFKFGSAGGTGFNPLGGITVKGGLKYNEKLRVDTYLAPELIAALNRFYLGVDVKTLLSWGELEKLKVSGLTVGPRLRYTAVFGEGGDKIIHQWEGSVEATARFPKIPFMHGTPVEVSLTAGGIGDVNADIGKGIPTTPFGSVSIKVPFMVRKKTAAEIAEDNKKKEEKIRKKKEEQLRKDNAAKEKEEGKKK